MSTKPASQHPTSEKPVSVVPMTSASEDLAKLRSQYGVGPIHLTGTESALYERRLLFDNVVDLRVADARESAIVSDAQAIVSNALLASD